MSTARDEWELVFPDDDAELAAEFRRHGVKAGQRLHIEVVTVADPEPATTERAEEEVPAFFASFDGPPDLASRVKDILRAEMPSKTR
ncbi:MAG TPA: hypothetical protein VME22_09405 [Solirubrobacteraceae bacterium]|nr:hypothetical protein [Solirubrobacteraceae bacterium]